MKAWKKKWRSNLLTRGEDWLFNILKNRRDERLLEFQRVLNEIKIERFPNGFPKAHIEPISLWPRG